MISEDVLERGLADLGEQYDVPAGAVDRLRATLEPDQADATSANHRWAHRPTARGWLAMSAAAVVALVGIAFAIGGQSHPPVQTAEKVSGGERFDAPGAPSSVGSTGAVPVPSGGGTSGSGGGTSFGAVHAHAARVPQSAHGPSFVADRNDAAKSLVPGASGSARVVKTGHVDLQVRKGAVSVLGQVTALADLEQGFVADSSSTEGGGVPSGRATLRIPVANFDDAVNRVRAIGHGPGAKILDLETSGQDVTSQYVDLQARIKALRATRSQFITLLSKARTIGQTLAVQQRITDVQTQLEQLQGQLKVLSSQTSYSTLTVTVDQRLAPVAIKVHHQASGLHRAFDRSVSRFARGFDAIVAAIGPILLVVLVGGALWLGAWFGYRRLRRSLV
ncbi:MAG: DUF4349 domain-containing protein [Frankiales bacterium]|nr:DUF4349 domain-containing protein [Frankiales bacterium]